MNALPAPFWWLNLFVDLTGLKDAQAVGKTFLGVFMSMFLEEIGIRISDWIKKIALKSVSIIQSSASLNRTKRQREGEFALCLGWDSHLLLPKDISTRGSRALGFGLALHHWLY